jgi:ribosome-associated translation inhibitor RaiA
VHLSDVNADKGGVDKRCLVEVRLAGHQPLVAEDTGEDLYTVVSKAAERVNRVVAHHLGRLHDRR